MVRAAALLVLVGSILAGCGGTSSNGEASKPAQQILADAKRAATSANAVHYHGSLVSNGARLTIDLTVDARRGGTGHMAMQSLGFDLVRIGDRVYIKGSDAFLTRFAGAGAARLLHGRWLVFPASTGRLAVLTQLTDTTRLFSLFTSKDSLAKGEETTVDGQKVIPIHSAKSRGTLYVAATGTPYPVEVVGDASSPGTLTFDGWNTSVRLIAPKGAMYIPSVTG